MKAVICEIRINGPHAFDVCVLPEWDLSSDVVERCDRAAHALCRYAAIAERFRDAGWTLIRKLPRLDAGAAARGTHMFRQQGTLDDRPGANPHINTGVSGLTFEMHPMGTGVNERLIIRCADDGDV